jgi:hypothetical protein
MTVMMLQNHVGRKQRQMNAVQSFYLWNISSSGHPPALAIHPCSELRVVGTLRLLMANDTFGIGQPWRYVWAVTQYLAMRLARSKRISMSIKTRKITGDYIELGSYKRQGAQSSESMHVPWQETTTLRQTKAGLSSPALRPMGEEMSNGSR